MLKKYRCVLPSGTKEQTAMILGRPVTLVHDKVYTEGVVTKAYPSYFKILKDNVVDSVVKKTPEPVVVREEVKKEEEVVISEVVDSGDTLIPEESLVVEKSTPKPKIRLNSRKKK